MFDLRTALANLNDRSFDFDALMKILAQIRREHFGEISPEVGVRELLLIAKQRDWIREDENGEFHIEIQKAA
jgi:hypothetical protein